MLKSFKVLISSLFILSVVFSGGGITEISAQEAPEKIYSLDFSEFENPQDAYNILPDVELENGDAFLNTNDLDTVFEQQNNMNNSMNRRRTGGELWTVTSTSTYRALGPVGGYYKEKISAGTSLGYSNSISFSIGGTVWGVALTGSFQFTFSYNRTGPTGTEAVGSYKATHRYFTAVARAKILKINYKVTDKYTGAVLRYETQYVLSNQATDHYGVLAHLNGGNGTVTIRSVSGNSTKSMSESSFISKLNSQNCWSTISF